MLRAEIPWITTCGSSESTTSANSFTPDSFFSAYAIFGISDHAAEKSTEHLISRDIETTGGVHVKFPGTTDLIEFHRVASQELFPP